MRKSGICKLKLLVLFFTLAGVSTFVLYGQGEVYDNGWWVMTYNVENLLDTIDRINTDDDEFTPESPKRWNSYRYYHKLDQIAQVISRAGGDAWPRLVALQEVEHGGVVSDLISRPSLLKAGYAYISTDSHDPRGMDVALLYRSQDMLLVEHRSYRISLPGDKRTRDILHATFRLGNEEPLHTLVVHLSSRRSGAKFSESYRRVAGRYLREICDSLYRSEGEGVRILVMGDFNGEPDEQATRTELGAYPEGEYNKAPSQADGIGLELINLAPQRGKDKPWGTYCYRGVWSQLDQCILSRSLYQRAKGIGYVPHSLEIFAPSYMRQGKTHAGILPPWRTYAGNYYAGGYSDHFPLRMRLVLKVIH